MNKNPVANRFIFNEKIDSEYLFSLYHDDYLYIAEIFQTTLDHFDEDLEILKHAFAARDIAGLKKATHKLKPVFGFTGLLTMQDDANDFENLCLAEKNFSALTDRYQKLLGEILHSKEIIEQELQRLTEYTAAQL